MMFHDDITQLKAINVIESVSLTTLIHIDQSENFLAFFSAATGGNASCFESRRSRAFSSLAPIARVDISSAFDWLGMNLCLLRLGTSRRLNPSASFSIKACLSTLGIVGSELVEHML